ncbi:DUF3895 domain-containing protein [Lederbergia wuyishanensis]|uniref:DUF3895 domain-containing protein n=1 Tax=Lederbergia wuyishanensis TaxID=1347903 RepID=A0ABU0D5T1_9BACI|nr:DUF3895 domain-containing protein [Lederbergia wuyishanensis]MCJ8008311.1 DUF3895 domain-containing protein [Lederbergia wuyishanensis]MDQ0343723.1 hypothetical protein [Lederbergia wuyishanensis]
MKIVLSRSEKDSILDSLTPEQKEFIQHHVKRGKKTAFANVLAVDKGLVIPEHAGLEEAEMLLDEWILEEYIDNGFVNPETPCECGRPLRHQYIVRHKGTNETRRFGIEHFKEHTGFSSEIINEIRKGFNIVDYEMDEILYKIQNRWELKQEIPFLPNDFEMPKTFQTFLELGLPLLDKHVHELKKLIREQTEQAREQRFFEPSVNEPPSLHITFNLDDYLFEDTFRTAPDSFSKDKTLELLESGVSSTRILCELLIKHGYASMERYITGKPKIYGPVCMFLESLVAREVLQRGKKLGEDDRYYHLK